MFQRFTFNSIFWMLIGFGLLGWGIYNVWEFRRNLSAIASFYVFPIIASFVLLGLAAILCGYTNGFTDHSPLGRKINKVAILLALAGLPLAGYAIWKIL